MRARARTITQGGQSHKQNIAIDGAITNCCFPLYYTLIELKSLICVRKKISASGHIMVLRSPRAYIFNMPRMIKQSIIVLYTEQTNNLIFSLTYK